MEVRIYGNLKLIMFLWFCNLICRQKLMNRNCNLLKKERSIPFPCSLMGANPARHMRGHWRKRWDAWGWRKTLRLWKAIDECRECEGTQRLQKCKWCLWRTELNRLRKRKTNKQTNSLGFLRTLDLWWSSC